MSGEELLSRFDANVPDPSDIRRVYSGRGVSGSSSFAWNADRGLHRGLQGTYCLTVGGLQIHPFRQA